MILSTDHIGNSVQTLAQIEVVKRAGTTRGSSLSVKNGQDGISGSSSILSLASRDIYRTSIITPSSKILPPAQTSILILREITTNPNSEQN
jgi:hypothetical protein